MSRVLAWAWNLRGRATRRLAGRGCWAACPFETWGSRFAGEDDGNGWRVSIRDWVMACACVCVSVVCSSSSSLADDMFFFFMA